MQVTLDPASSVEEEGQSQNECLPEVDLSSTQCERSRLSTNELKCLDHRSLVQMMDAERSSCGLVDEERGSELCSSVQSLSIHTLHRGRLADGLGCCRLKNEQDSRHKLCKDTISASSSSHDVSQIQTDKRHTSTSKIQGQCHRTLHCSLGHLQTDITYLHDDSKFRKISHNKNPPVSMHIHKNRTSFTFANFIFTSIFLVSLFSPSLSLTTSSASTSPNLKSWSLAALETIDTGMEHEMGSHRVPVPDLTTIVGKLFQFQIPSSAFSGEVSQYKAIRAGSRELPKWIHFDKNAGLFSGVPLPEDKGQVYISVDGHIVSTNSKISVQTTIFSLNVIQPNLSTNSSILKHTVIAEEPASNCNQSSMTPLDQCLPSKARVLANILLLVPFNSLTPSEKTQLFINTATLFDTCLQHLELRSINWTSDEGVWLWSKLATGEIINTLESATILSFQIGCDNFNYFTQSPLLELMARSTDICREGLLLSDEGYIWVNCHQWFITAGTKTFLSQTDALQAFSPSKEKTRTKRQAFDGTDGPLDFPDYGINNGNEPSTPSTTMSSTPSLKTSISSTQLQIVASSASESSSSAISLMPSFSVNQPQNSTIIQSIQPTSLAMPQPSNSVPNSLTISFTLSEAKRSIIAETGSAPIQFQATPKPTEFAGSGSGLGSGPGVELSPDFSSSMEGVFFIGPTSIGQAESILVPMPEPSTSILSGALRSNNIMSSSMAFSSIEVTEPQTQIPFLTVSSSPTSRPFIRVSSSPTQSPSTRTITSSSPVDRLSPRISSSAIDPPIDETTAVMMIITPTPSMSQLSFSIASTIEVLTSTVRASPSVESSTEASPTQTFLFSMGSSDILRPLPLTTSPVIDFTVSSDIVATIVPSSTPIRTTNVLMPLPTSELSLSMSMFSPSSFPPDSSSIFMPIFTSSFVPSSALPVSPTPTTRSDVRLRPMSTSELTLSISMFTPTPIQSSTTIATTSQISSSFFSPMPTPSHTVTSEVSSILSVGETITSSFIFVMDSSESLIIPFSTSMVQLPSSSLALSSSFFSSSPFISPSPTPDISEIPIIPVPSPTPSMVPTICDVIDCNNGNCIPDESDTNFTCQCFPGYTGEFCDEMIESSSFIPMPTPSPPIGICDIIDCNNGACLADDFSDNFTCQCDTGFTGEFCDIPLSVSSMITPTSSISLTSSFIFIIPSSESLLVPFLTSTTPFFTSSDFTFSISSSDFILLPSSVPPIPSSAVSITSSLQATPVPSSLTTTAASSSLLITGAPSSLLTMAASSSLSVMATPSTSSIIVSPTPSVNISMCDFFNCTNGVCIELEGDFVICECFPGFTGLFCEVPMASSSFILTISPTPSPPVDICDFIDCNNGTCVADEFGENFTCQCFAGYTGEFCDIPLPTSTFMTLTPLSSFILTVSPTPSPPFNICDFIECNNGTCFTDKFGDNFTCQCFAGFTGEFCDILLPTSTFLTSTPSSSFILTASPTPSPPFNICDFIECNNGTCFTDEFGDNFTCQCFAGFTGEFCDILLPTSTFLTSTPSSSFILTASPTPSPPFNICDFIECNNGTCFTDEFGDNFTCQCFAGFTGEFCDILLPTFTFLTSTPSSSFILTASPTPSPPFNTCDFIECNNGTCFTDEFGDNFTCQCFAGFTGEFCDILLPTSTFLTSTPSSSFILTASPTPSPPFNTCDFIECNNGTCFSDEIGDNFTCQCFAGFTGEFCDILLPSTSLFITPTPATTSDLGVMTTSSIFFFVSSSESLLLPFSTFTTSTIPMSSVSISPTPSPPISLCDFVNCTNGECLDLGNDTIMCECFAGFTGMFCEVPIVIESTSFAFTVTPTPTPSPPVSICNFIDCNNGTCLVDEFGENFTCQCVAGYTGQFCDILLPTSTFAFSIPSSSFILTASPSPSPPFDICDFIDCSNGTCVADEFGENFTCQCFVGYTGEFCDIPLILSSSIPPISVSSSMQFLIPSSESLLAPFSSPSPSIISTTSTPPIATPITQTPPITTPVAITPTPSPNISLCEFINCTNGECIDFGDDFVMCECFPGWTGMFCDMPIVSSSFVLSLSPTPSPSPIGVCDLIDCNNGTCVTDMFGENFTCQCFAGWTGEFCDIPLPPPSICDLVNCSGNGECVDLGDNFNCSCFPGFTGELCDTPLTLSPSLSSTMFISPTATPSPSPPISICDFINCSGNGNCTDLGDDFNCSCLPEYTGELCDIPLSPSPTQTSSVTEAFSTSSMFTFLVPSSESLLIPLPTPTTFIFFSSPLPTPSPSPPVNFCDFENCSGNGECNNLGDGFNCTCYIGWTGTLCETDIDFCQPDKFGSCNQTGTAMCVDGNSTHTCECLAGFTGDLCSVDIDDCDPDPCFNNATCINLLFDEFMCECLPRFTGELCAETFSPCDPNPCKEPDEVCIVTGFEEGDFMCIAPPTTTSMISPSITDSLTSIVTPSFSSTAVQLTSIASLSTSSVLTSTSAMPTPTPVPPNSAPIVLNPIGTLLANEGQVTHFTIPELTFYDLESGSTSNLRLSLLDSGASELPNTTWIHVNGGAIQALPLREQAIFGIVTEYTFILRASDERGASTHDFVTIRVLRQREDFQNFLVVLFEGSFTTFNQSLTEKISLAQRLSAHTNGTVSSVATVLSTPNMYISAFRNGSIAVVYRDISIPDTHCANFRAWVATVYADSSYSPSFIQILSPRFIPTAQPVIEGPCNLTDVNPTLAATQGLSPVPQSNIILFLAIVIPTIFVACICLLIGILLFINYRSRRSERKSLKSKAMERTFTRRRPVILDEEWDLPNRRRRPVILPSDYTIANMRALAIADPANDGNGGRRLLLEEVDYGREDGSSDEEEIVTSPGLSLTLRNRHALMSPDPPVDEGPPPYVLPPLFPT